MASMKLTIPQRLASAGLVLLLATPAGAALRDGTKPDRPDPMARARDLYNQGHYEGAIESAKQAQTNPFT